MAEAPFVSIVLATYNRESYLKESLDSALKQTYPNFEVIVTDNASPLYDIHEVLKGYNDSRLKIFRQTENIGFIRNWNFGLNSAKGKYIKVLGDDDLLLPNCISEEVKVLENHPNVGFVCSNYDIIDGDGRLLINSLFQENAFRLFHKDYEEYGFDFIVNYLKGHRRVGNPTALLFRKNLAHEVGGFDADAGYPADADLWLSLARISNFYYLDKKLLKIRWHSGNLTHSVRSVADHLRLIKKNSLAVENSSWSDQLKIELKVLRMYLSQFKIFVKKVFTP